MGIDIGVMNAKAETSMILVNNERMLGSTIDRVFSPLKLMRSVNGEDKPFLITFEHWAILSIVTSQAYSWEGEATTTMTYAAGAMWLDSASGVVHRILREMQGILVVQRDNAIDGRISHWRIKDEKIMRAIDEVARIKLLIAEVVKEQVANPEDGTAGIDKLPPELAGIYFNVVAVKAKYIEKKQVRIAEAEAAVQKVLKGETKAAANLNRKIAAKSQRKV